MDEDKKILFLRHGETDWNSQLRYQGTMDVPLNSKGEKQAAAASGRLANWVPDHVAVSPLKRAVRTAEIIGKKRRWTMEPQVFDGLREVDFGEWEGRQISDVIDTYGDVYFRWRDDPGSWSPPGGESLESVKERFMAVLESLLAMDGSKFLIVTHGGVIRAALSALLDFPPGVSWKMTLGNCSYTALTLWRGRILLNFLNDCVHQGLPEKKILDLPLNL